MARNWRETLQPIRWRVRFEVRSWPRLIQTRFSAKYSIFPDNRNVFFVFFSRFCSPSSQNIDWKCRLIEFNACYFSCILAVKFELQVMPIDVCKMSISGNVCHYLIAHQRNNCLILQFLAFCDQQNNLKIQLRLLKFLKSCLYLWNSSEDLLLILAVEQKPST